MSAAPPAGTVTSNPSTPTPPPARFGLVAGASVLMALTVEAALENLWRASPLRWWTVAAVAGWLLVVVAGRRVIGWRGRAAGTALVLLALVLAADFFVGSGASGGFHVAGLALGRIIALTAVAGVAVACVALLRLHAVRARVWLAVAAGLVGLYGVLPIVIAFVRDMPVSRTVLGEGFWTLPPFWLQGTYVAAELLIPVGLLVTLVLVARSWFPNVPADRRFAAPAALVLLVAFVVLSVELSRAGVPHLARAAVDPWLAHVGPPAVTASQPVVAGPAAASAAPNALLAATLDESWLKRYRGMTIDQAFVEVATRMRYEPYPGVLRSARGTALAAGGNSIDKSLLLAAILREGGYEVRFVRGQLTGPNLAAILRGLYPPKVPSLQLAAEFAPYDPAQDPVLQAFAREHTWVEINQGDTWLPLDPSFPRARIGESYAEAVTRFTEPADADFQRLEMKIKVQTGGRVADLGGFSGKVADLALQPIALVIDATPVREAAAAAPAEPSGGGLFGEALGGRKAEPEPPKKTGERPLIGVRFTRSLLVGDSPRAVRATVSLARNAATHVQREWLEFTLTGPGGLQRRFDRVIQEGAVAGAPLDLTARHRRIGITVLSGPVSFDYVSQQTARIRPALDLDAARRDLSAVGAGTDNAKASAPLAGAHHV